MMFFEVLRLPFVDENLILGCGRYIKQKLSAATWGDKTVDELAVFIQKNNPELKGFSRRGLYRMIQFYETYVKSKFVPPTVAQLQKTESQSDEKASPAVAQFQFQDIRNTLLAELSWTHHLIIFSRCRTEEEREFYLRMSIREKYSKRELDRQISASHFERTMLGTPCYLQW